MSIMRARQLEVVAAGGGDRCPTRAARCPRRRRTGRAGSAASSAARRAPPRAASTSGSSSLTRALTACIAAIASRRVGAGALGLADRLRAGVALGLRVLELGPQRVRAARAAPARRRSRSSEPSRRRASAARTGSGSRVIARRSSIGLPAAGSRRLVAPARRHFRLGVLGEELGERLGLRAGDDVLRHRARRRTRRCGSRTARSSSVTWRWSKFGPSLYSRVRTLVAEPCVPATLSVWQPEQRSLKIAAAADCSGSG